MKFKIIASGSKGNCTIVLCDNTNLIIDMGISYLTLKRSLEENSLSFTNFSGILITHCHNDHIKGLGALLKHTKLNIYIPKEMYESLKEYVELDRCIFIEDNFMINDINIEYLNKSLVYVTDTGYINRKYLNKMIDKNAYIIESNHDEIMLMDGPYPRFLKERVISDQGHLSNKTTAKYLKKVIGKNTKLVVLAHLSEKNNTPEKALEAMQEVGIDKSVDIMIAKQYEESTIIEV